MLAPSSTFSFLIRDRSSNTSSICALVFTNFARIANWSVDLVSSRYNSEAKEESSNTSSHLSTVERVRKAEFQEPEERGSTSHTDFGRQPETFDLEGSIFGNNPIPQIDPRSALLQAIVSRKTNKEESPEKIKKDINPKTVMTGENEDKSDGRSDHLSSLHALVDPRSALLNAITKRFQDKEKSEPVEVPTEHRSPSTPERDPRSALLNAITRRNIDSEKREEAVNSCSSSTSEEDPRSALHNAIKSRRIDDTIKGERTVDNNIDQSSDPNLSEEENSIISVEIGTMGGGLPNKLLPFLKVLTGRVG